MFLRKFRDNVKKYPNKIVVVSGKESWTYRELDLYSDLVADELINHGVKKGVPVGYYDYASASTLAVIIGIWKVNAIYVPIAKNNPMHRVRVILEESNTKTLITADETVNIEGIHVVNINACIKKSRIGNSYVEDNDPDDIAYILFTSGSTGKPKGVMTEHRGILNHLMAKEKILNITCDSKILQDASLGFVISIWQLLLPLIVGSTTYIVDAQYRNNIHKYIERLREYKIQIIEVVPTYLELLINYVMSKGITLEELQYIVVTGERFNKSLAKQCFQCFKGVKVINAYGATEVSDDVLHCIVDPSINYDEIPIGKAIDNMRIDILDDNYMPVENGKTGNIVLTGISVSKGYINSVNEDKKFVNNIVSEDSRSYITGDYGYIGSDGLCYYCGRKNSFVKVNGMRVDIGEIETLLRDIPFIEDAVVILQGKSSNQMSELHAFLKLKSKKENIPILIYDALIKKVPYYMIPTLYTFCSSFPVAINGKIDYKALSGTQLF